MPGEFENTDAPDDDIRLLQLTGQGDREAFSRLYDRFAGILFATALTVLHQHETAADVLQDVFLTIWEKAPLYDPARGRPLTWALTLTRNRAIDRLRSAERRQRLAGAAARESLTDSPRDDRDSLSVIISAERSARVRAALQQLSPEQRQAIEMTFFGSLTHHEAAAQLGEPLGTIKARIRRGLLRLRDLLAGQI